MQLSLPGRDRQRNGQPHSQVPGSTVRPHQRGFEFGAALQRPELGPLGLSLDSTLSPAVCTP